MEQVPCIARESIHDGNFSSKRRKIEGVTLQPAQFCFTHNCMCDAHHPVDIDVSGLPCPDNSKANRRRLFEEGASGPVYITWAQKHRRNRTPLMILENVPDPRLQMWERLLVGV